MDISKIWAGVVGKITARFERPDPNSYYIDLATMIKAVEPMPNPHRIVAGHEETSYKWSKMSYWVGRTITHTKSDKALFGQLETSIFNIAGTIKAQKEKQTIRIPREPMDYLLTNIILLDESVTFYGRKPLNDPKITFLRSSDKHLVTGTNIPIPAHDATYPDKSAYIRHFYDTLKHIPLKPQPLPEPFIEP